MAKKKYKKIWNSKEEYDHEARVEANLRRLRELAEKAQAELERKGGETATS